MVRFICCFKVSNNFLYTSLRLSTIYTYKIGLLSKLYVLKVNTYVNDKMKNKIMSLWEHKIKTQKKKTTKCIMGMLEKKPVLFRPLNNGFIQTTYYATIVNKTNFRNICEQNIHRFIFICENIMTFIHRDVKVVIQSHPPRRPGGGGAILKWGEITRYPIFYVRFVL